MTHNYFLSNADGARASGVYRPLTIVSFWLNYQAAGLNPAAFHLFNLFFHALNAFWVFYILRILAKSETAGFIAGLFFAVLPNHPEAVSWISGRGDALATFFYLSAFILYIVFRERGGRWRLAASLGTFLLALFSKELAITLPAVLIAYEMIWQISLPAGPSADEAGEAGQSKQIKRAFFYLLPFVAALAGYFVLRFFATGLFYGFYATSNLNFSLSRAWETLGGGFISNFLTGENIFALWPLLPALGGILVIMFGALLRPAARRIYIFGILFFIIAAAPAFYLQLNRLTGEGERFVYLPSVGFSILLAILFTDFLERKSRTLLPLSAALLASVYFGWLLWNKNINWRGAGELSRSLLFNFGQTVDLTKTNQGVVILGLPDNLDGAQIFRNGWLSALDLYYPFYAPDVLTVKAGLNLVAESDAAAISWQAAADGFVGEGARPIFFGPKNLESLDYIMRIENYQKNILSGSRIEFNFTPQFKKQNENKKILFLTTKGKRFEELKPF